MTYNHAGNRAQTSRYTTGSGGTQDHTVNELNQIEEFENVPRALVSGDGPTSANVELSDYFNPPMTPSRAHKYFYHAFEDVRINEGWAGVEVYVNSSLVDEIDVPVRQHEESRDFDADGNPTASGEMVYRYDGESRVIEQWWSNAGWPWARVRHVYDWQGRRARSQILFGSDPEDPDETVTFDLVYLGGRLISQVITSDSTTSGHVPTQELYLWGLDRSGTLEGAGTIGGLLAMTKGWDATAAEHSLVAQDGLGNVVAYLNPATGERRAEFEYGPFGETLRTTAAPSFGAYRTYEYGHRWQNKFSSAFLAGLDVPHPETYDFGLRAYEPSLGRWLNRDPIGVAGGSNVYAYVGNNPFGGWDAWGLSAEVFDGGWLPEFIVGPIDSGLDAYYWNGMWCRMGVCWQADPSTDSPANYPDSSTGGGNGGAPSDPEEEARKKECNEIRADIDVAKKMVNANWQQIMNVRNITSENAAVENLLDTVSIAEDASDILDYATYGKYAATLGTVSIYLGTVGQVSSIFEFGAGFGEFVDGGSSGRMVSGGASYVLGAGTMILASETAKGAAIGSGAYMVTAGFVTTVALPITIGGGVAIGVGLYGYSKYADYQGEKMDADFDRSQVDQHLDNLSRLKDLQRAFDEKECNKIAE